jgi:hypothetical protein
MAQNRVKLKFYNISLGLYISQEYGRKNGVLGTFFCLVQHKIQVVAMITRISNLNLKIFLKITGLDF